MNQPEIHNMGGIIRRVRKERGWRLEDVADENISPATISNIERGVPHVNPNKTNYLLKKLGIGTDRLPELIMSEKRELQNLDFQFLMIEAQWEMGQWDQALTQLDQLDLDDQHPYAAARHLWKGKCLSGKKSWKRAERSFYKAIQLCNPNGSSDSTNVEAFSFLELGLCSYYQNDLEKALQLTESGIDAFTPDGSRRYLWPLLHRNKGVYLEHLDRVAEGLKLVQEIWDSLDAIDDAETVLTFYWLRSELLCRTGMYEDAIRYAVDGVQIARRNHRYHLMFSLFSVLGSAYMAQEEWEKAEDSFDLALSCKEKMTGEKKRLIRTYDRLGILYMRQGKFEKAFSVIDQAIQYGESSQDIPRLTHTLLLMGDCYRLQGNREEAIRYYERALGLAQEHGYKRKENQALYALAQCWSGVDENEFQRCMGDGGSKWWLMSQIT
ncbi:tetratricopeptide repeat protein [Paludifilum halophilum]|nr:tetratricopeptide repeat protein [Paludifilum halophilum]